MLTVIFLKWTESQFHNSQSLVMLQLGLAVALTHPPPNICPTFLPTALPSLSGTEPVAHSGKQEEAHLRTKQLAGFCQKSALLEHSSTNGTARILPVSFPGQPDGETWASEVSCTGHAS